jgi:hypothetical protein
VATGRITGLTASADATGTRWHACQRCTPVATTEVTTTATRWGLCVACCKPGLAFVTQLEREQARCGFCGEVLVPSDKDLSALAARVIAEPLRHERHERGA